MNIKYRSDDTIVAAIGLDRYTHSIVNTAASLCERGDFRLRIVHVCHHLSTHTELYPSEGECGENMQLQKQAELTAKKQVENIKSKLPAHISVETRIMTGCPSEWIQADAIAHDAFMIMVGVGRSAQRFIPTGWSTALSLMAHSKVPVMVLDDRHPLDFSKGKLRIGVADDLSEHSSTIVKFGRTLCERLKHCHMFHMHVTGLTPETLNLSLQSALASAHQSAGLALPVENIYQLTLEQLKNKMQERAGTAQDQFEARDCLYDVEIESGEPVSEIHAMMERCELDLAIFGRHHRLRKNPILMGRIPHRFMVSEQRPVMILPVEP